MPISLIGTFSSSLIVITMPPLAVESSLARIRPLIATACLNSLACEIAFCPVVALRMRR